MGNTTSCCVSSSPKLRRNAHSRLESYRPDTDLSREDTGCNLQHISDRENIDGERRRSLSLSPPAGLGALRVRCLRARPAGSGGNFASHRPPGVGQACRGATVCMCLCCPEVTGKASGRVLLGYCQSRYVLGGSVICPFLKEGNCHNGEFCTWRSLPGVGLRSPQTTLFQHYSPPPQKKT